ncbi:hypothetical protein EXN51_26415 [Agrobacterium fabrum]|uniref:Uncharacterized protein n=1 Tax=Agrobacterium fabrum (strain C58 / ATCC 33970) TaxID=176299 RepID=Q8U5T1_AGRFC|nr:hypothetical protein Atu8064 [Agrobacterium fabrum str. C58]KJX90011.1 hypothetical protein SY94_5414 [Agrobacterium tumefaciens]TRB22781.1 hypothetical protein EXN51_26415 [Agrobacterium fabrum]
MVAELVEITNVVSFLFLPKTRYLTGSVIDVNGGLY